MKNEWSTKWQLHEKHFLEGILTESCEIRIISLVH